MISATQHLLIEQELTSSRWGRTSPKESFGIFGPQEGVSRFSYSKIWRQQK